MYKSGKYIAIVASCSNKKCWLQLAGTICEACKNYRKILLVDETSQHTQEVTLLKAQNWCFKKSLQSLQFLRGLCFHCQGFTEASWLYILPKNLFISRFLEASSPHEEDGKVCRKRSCDKIGISQTRTNSCALPVSRFAKAKFAGELCAFLSVCKPLFVALINPLIFENFEVSFE